MQLISVRGYVIAVEAKSGSQLIFIKRQYEERSDEQLARYAEETVDLLVGREARISD